MGKTGGLGALDPTGFDMTSALSYLLVFSQVFPRVSLLECSLSFLSARSVPCLHFSLGMLQILSGPTVCPKIVWVESH